MEFFKGSIIGERDKQEDYGLIQTYPSNNSLVAIIADGMGGQIAGEIASSKAVESFLSSFEKNTTENVSTKLAVALQNANHELNRLIASNPKLSGMGCTLLSVVISRSSLNWISVGDSILYLYRSQRLTKLNDDHSMYPVLLESFKKGKISEEEMRTHPNRNALRSALTGDEIPIIDLKESSKTLIKNDILILATDGLLTLSEKDIQEILNANYKNSAENICKKLLIEVSDRKRRKQDNTLIEVIKISEGTAGSSLSTNKVLYILLFLFFTVLISTAIVFWSELINSFLKVVGGSAPSSPVVIQKTEVDNVKPFPIPNDSPSIPPSSTENKITKGQTDNKSEAKESQKEAKSAKDKKPKTVSIIVSDELKNKTTTQQQAPAAQQQAPATQQQAPAAQQQAPAAQQQAPAAQQQAPAAQQQAPAAQQQAPAASSHTATGSKDVVRYINTEEEKKVKKLLGND